LRRLEAFLPLAGRDYASGRNADLGPGDRSNVSVLSPYLRYRLLGEAEVVAAVLARHSASAAAKFVQEVAWRTYWKGWLELRPAVWARFLADREDARGRLQEDRALFDSVSQAEAGVTGIEGFDAWARELLATGYLHNHARMWFASIWIFTLGLPWTLGADFFLRHLVDADPASNTLSWRWVAGLQTPGKTYLATADNIARYTGGRFHPAGLAGHAVALTEPPLPAARALRSRPAVDWSQPMLLLVHAEDFHPESLVPPGAAVRAAVVWGGGEEGWPWGDKAAAFVAAGAEDTASRLRKHFGCDVTVVDELSAGSLAAMAADAGAAAIVTPEAPVGAVAAALGRLSDALAERARPIAVVRRDWDERLWPLATKGYFAFRERLPDMLRELGI
jgi:deoxyribodipyrimidine photo-lyase